MSKQTNFPSLFLLCAVLKMDVIKRFLEFWCHIESKLSWSSPVEGESQVSQQQTLSWICSYTVAGCICSLALIISTGVWLLFELLQFMHQRASVRYALYKSVFEINGSQLWSFLALSAYTEQCCFSIELPSCSLPTAVRFDLNDCIWELMMAEKQGFRVLIVTFPLLEHLANLK